MDIIPAIDLIDGKCVRLTQGDYKNKTVYNDDPVEVAKMFEDAGIKRLHLVDLDGAKQKTVVNTHVLKAITQQTNMVVDFGGGIQSETDLQKAFDNGAAMVTCGSIAVKQRDVFEGWVQKYGGDTIILAADAKDGKVAVSGWQETSSVDLLQFIEEYVSKGVTSVLCTDISRDGMLQGPAVELYKTIQQRFPDLKLIASGGVSGMRDLEELNEAGIYSVVVGKAFYEGRITLDQLASFK
ncbi:1-(5-phosphoribosyl)-5-[(5-phosphoribosylamino)methylideneamino]imidazole-4-carboxamide isomerase [Limibacter armeniacum]|uniref:1-(5-phosphoribosyl)-5-[(5- phosphoribosylamino)methylideneamino]imidazole-4- carboxamide isomerase n=1 Tax=Limibacter armeniacum TaxID=466084 RepID=UPI002FE58F99